MSTLLLLLNNLILPRGLANPTNDLKEAQSLIKNALNVFPKSSVFYVMGSQCYRKLGDLDTSITFMEKALESCEHSVSSLPQNYVYELANCYTLKMEWRKALGFFEKVRNHSSFENACLASLQAASCLQLLGICLFR